MNYAVFESGGKQHRVSEGQIIVLEKLPEQAGEEVTFKNVLMLENDGKVKLGQPYIAGAKVTAKVLEQGRDKKIKVLKFKRRKHYMRTSGHRQYITTVQISSIA